MQRNHKSTAKRPTEWTKQGWEKYEQYVGWYDTSYSVRMRCLSKSSDPSTQVHIHYYSSYRICTEQTKTLWRAHISSWGNFTHFWGMFVVPFSPLHINHLSDHAQISLSVSSWRRLNNHCATKFWSLVRADLPTSGSCSFFTWLWLNSSFQSSSLFYILLSFSLSADRSPVPPAVSISHC